MSCMCENQMKARELERMRRLAKALAKMEGNTVVLYIKADGAYDFDLADNYDETKGRIAEYITRY